MNNDIVRLGNFRKYKDSKPWMISAAYESNIAYFNSPRMKSEYIRLWKNNVEIPQSNVLLEKQRIEASLNQLFDVNQSLTTILNSLEQKEKNKEIQTAAEYISTFFEHISEKYGDLARDESKKLAEVARGKKIRNIDESIRAIDKYKSSINKKFNAKDREAIINSLKSLDLDEASKEFYKFNRAFKYSGSLFNIASLIEALSESVKTGDWRPFYLEVEKLVLDKLVSSVIAIMLISLTGTSLGILGYGLLMMSVSALINDELVEEIHNIFFS